MYYFAVVGTMVVEAIVRAQAGRITQNGRTMKVSELTGALLDYWVAKAEGRNDCVLADEGVWKVLPHSVGDTLAGDPYRPSVDWSQGGPIIERERITVIDHCIDLEPSLLSDPEFCRTNAWRALHGQKDCSHNFEYCADIEQRGETYLIAAMRAYVASKYGDEVPDIPTQN